MIRRGGRSFPRPSARRGAIVVFAMIAMLVATLLSAELVKMAGISHRLAKHDEWFAQANRLADAGCARVSLLIERDPNITEDEWKISADQLPSGQAAIVRIKIDTRSPDRVISVVAEYPTNHPDVVRATRELRMSR